MVELVPQGGETELEWLRCQALMDLSTLLIIGRDMHHNQQRTRASIEVCDEIIDRWQSSSEAWLRVNVAATMVNKAINCMEIDEESEARRIYERIVELFTADIADTGNSKLSEHVYIARHALNVLETTRIPDPEFKTGYLEAMMRATRRTGRYDPEGRVGVPRDYDVHSIRLAGQNHHATTSLVRRAACSGDPTVLLLRNFDLTETSFVSSDPNPVFGRDDPDGYTREIRYTDGQDLLNRKPRRLMSCRSPTPMQPCLGSTVSLIFCSTSPRDCSGTRRLSVDADPEKLTCEAEYDRYARASAVTTRTLPADTPGKYEHRRTRHQQAHPGSRYR